MKKTIKSIMVTLSIILILSTKTTIINAQSIINQSPNAVFNESQIGDINNVIDPDSKGK